MAASRAALRAGDGRLVAGRVGRRGSRFLTIALVLAAVATLVGGTGAQGQEQAVLGTADNFAVLAASRVTNVGTTVISGGDVGVSPGSAITGFPPGVVVGGVIRRTDAVAAQAQVDAREAYNDLRSRSTECTDLTGQDLGTVSTEEDPLEPGVYCFSSSAFLTGNLYLEAGGEYVFLIGTTLITATGSRVVIVGGAQDGCNIYWAVGSSATLGTDSEFLGTIIAEASITLDDRAEVNGRLIALTGAVTLIDNDVTVPTCAGPTTTTTPGGTTTTTSGGGTTTTTSGGGTTTTLPPGGGGQGPTTTALQVTTTTGLAATTTTTAAQATTTTARSATTTTTVRPGTTGTTAPGAGTGLGAGGTDSLRAAGSGEALALTGPAELQPMLVAALLSVLLGGMMLMSSGPRVGSLSVAAGPQEAQRRGDADPAGVRDLQSDDGTAQGVTPPPLPPQAQAQVRAQSDSRRRDISRAEATRSALRSAESISWTLRLPDA